MLIGHDVLVRIREGKVDRVFRRWVAPRVKPGSRMRTAVGVVEVVSVEATTESAITLAQAQAAGFQSRDALLGWLAGREGEIYRIGLRFAGPDPRVELRERIPDRTELKEIQERLRRLDKLSSHGSWTAVTLAIIHQQPGARAEDLARELGREKKPFKLDVRKLKELGLTESLRVGYRLSPRGEAVLPFWRRDRGP